MAKGEVLAEKTHYCLMVGVCCHDASNRVAGVIITLAATMV